ncbi:hypothetical protein Vadar_003560 [Vaccinium darrowii]|uniref:Uncharacterized protein n=1 Tax=Vaccinium darrowii TaxID=229202 RepID=A0ACB7ZBD2_9ERIC|nr:hypothetical protein Vadar_003560 [Vaccinium darrowii]
MENQECGNLPNDCCRCWELIFQKVREDDERDLDSISLVSKQFLSISNRVKQSLTLNVNADTLHLLPNILRRFRHIKSIVIDTNILKNIYDSIAIDGVLDQIARYGILLNLHALRFQCHIEALRDGFRALALSKNMKNNLKVLDCSWVISMQDKDLVLIADLFPQLEELSIQADRYFFDDETAVRITDDGIGVLAAKLKELKEIEIYCPLDACFITDKSLESLSENCVKLRKIDLCISRADQHNVTEVGIDSVMRHSTNLTSLSLDLLSLQPPTSPFAIGNGFANAKNLHSLSLGQALISNKRISLLAKTYPPLKKLELSSFPGDNSEILGALKMLLHACQLTLEELSLSFWSLTNTDISDLAPYLSNLTSINLDGLSGLTSVTFYTLTKSCPLLKILTMVNMKGQEDTFSPDFLHKNYRMRHLDISKNPWLNDTILKNMGHVCPNLQFLRVSYCLRLTNVGIGEVLRRCPAITQLNINHLKVSNDFFGRYSDNSSKLNLKTLEACDNKISDEGMAMIGNRCPNLQYLNIGFCKQVTDKGVMEVVKKCKRLRNICLYGCEKVSTNILPEMVFSRPSLRKIDLPSKFDLTEETKNTVSSFGCRLIFNEA